LNSEGKISTAGFKESKVMDLDFLLPALYKPVLLYNIFYEFGKWNLTPESEPGLQMLLKVLKDNPNISIELSAHTDVRGSASANMVMSAKRAQACVDYLASKGVNITHLIAVGYGEERIRNKCKEHVACTEKEHAVNRRTEFRVVKFD